MAIPFLNNINLTDNQLLNAKLQVSSDAPTNAIGQIYFNTNAGENRVRVHNGTEFKAVAWYDDIPATIVESLTLNNSTFITLSNSGTATDPSITASLSASGTPSSSTFLRGDNTWATPISTNTTYDLDSLQTGSNVAITLVGSDASLDTITLVAGTNITLTDDGSNNITIDAANPDQTVTLIGEVEGSGTTSITTIVKDGVLDVANFNASAIVTAAEGIENNNNDTTLPTSAAVKAYADSLIVGGLIYQGGYNAATNTPDLDVSPSASIKKGWTYTVTADGLFFTEQVRVGDVIIAEVDAPTTLADWTTVQNNIDIASLSQIGIGNVNAGAGIGVSYSAGTATVSNTGVTSITAGTGISVSASTGAITISSNPSASQYATTISGTSTVSHNLGSRDIMVQLYDTVTYETVYADVDRDTTNAVIITFASTPTNSIRVLVQKIG